MTLERIATLVRRLPQLVLLGLLPLVLRPAASTLWLWLLVVAVVCAADAIAFGVMVALIVALLDFVKLSPGPPIKPHSPPRPPLPPRAQPVMPVMPSIRSTRVPAVPGFALCKAAEFKTPIPLPPVPPDAPPPNLLCTLKFVTLVPLPPVPPPPEINPRLLMVMNVRVVSATPPGAPPIRVAADTFTVQPCGNAALPKSSAPMIAAVIFTINGCVPFQPAAVASDRTLGA